MKRYLFSFLFILSALPIAAETPLNVVLIVADDHGLDAGCYGTPHLSTPNIDWLAQEGVLFENAFATTASCTASRSVILSGLQNHRTALYGHSHFPFHFRAFERLKTLPVLLAQHGYRTANVGKYHVAPEEVFHFDAYITQDDLETPLPEGEPFARNPVAMAQASRWFIEQDAPFFLYFCTVDPHRSDDADKPNRFGNRESGYTEVDPISYSPEQVLVPAYLPDTRECREELAQYYQSISRIDQGVGALIEILRKSGKLDETVIIYMSDHGPAFPGAKTTTYDPGLRSPLIVYHPELPSVGLRNQAMISWVDITPTIADIAGVPEPAPYRLDPHQPETIATVDGWHGRSFLPALFDVEAKGFDRIYASHTFHEVQMYYPMRVVRDRKYKLIWNIAHQLPYPFASDLWASQTWQAQWAKGPEAPFGMRTVNQYIHRPEFEFYDIVEDPHETRNLANDPEHQEALARFKNLLKTFQEETGDPWAQKWDYE